MTESCFLSPEIAPAFYIFIRSFIIVLISYTLEQFWFEAWFDKAPIAIIPKPSETAGHNPGTA
jgi:hypothetical protein